MDPISNLNHNTMGITLATNQGTIFIGNGYIPTNVDNMNEGNKEDFRRLHCELYTEAANHTHSILCMDANETTTKQGRIK